MDEKRGKKSCINENYKKQVEVKIEGGIQSC